MRESLIQEGMLVRIVCVHHPVFAKNVGEIERVMRMSSDGRQAWCKPVKLFPKKTRNGVVMQEACWETLRSVDSIEPVYGLVTSGVGQGA